MPLFASKDGKLIEVKENPFALEKDMQRVSEQNLSTIFNLEYVTSEFLLGGFRTDTLSFDHETKSFVVIEYKRDKNFSVIDQGVTYLNLMLNNRDSIIVEYNERTNKNLKRKDVDWKQSRVIFIAPSFSEYQQGAIGKGLPIELWEIKRYSNGAVTFNQVKASEGKESIASISKAGALVQKVSKEVKVYTEDEHVSHGSGKTKELYAELKSSILNIGNDITIKPVKRYIAFKRKTNFTDIIIQRSKLIININLPSGKLNDPQKLARDISGVGHWGNGDYEVHLSDRNLIHQILPLIKQSYDNNLSIRGQFSSSGRD